jgi:agmatinase
MSMLYYDVPKDTAAYAQSRVVILPCPYEHTTSYGKGTAKGPAALLQASTQVELFDEELWAESYRVGIHSAPAVAFAAKTGEAAVHLVAEKVSKLYADGKLPVVLGGEHTITSGCIMAARKVHPNLTVVQIDAHADLRDSYHNTQWSHACIMRRVVDMGIPSVGVGIRAICHEEAMLIREKKLLRILGHELDVAGKWIDRALAGISGPVFLTYDVDGLDPSLLPATGTPVPGGLSWEQSNAFLRALFSRHTVVGMDFVELAPNPEWPSSDFVAAKLIYKCIGYWARSQKLI